MVLSVEEESFAEGRDTGWSDSWTDEDLADATAESVRPV